MKTFPLLLNYNTLPEWPRYTLLGLLGIPFNVSIHTLGPFREQTEMHIVVCLV